MLSSGYQLLCLSCQWEMHMSKPATATATITTTLTTTITIALLDLAERKYAACSISQFRIGFSWTLSSGILALLFSCLWQPRYFLAMSAENNWKTFAFIAITFWRPFFRQLTAPPARHPLKEMWGNSSLVIFHIVIYLHFILSTIIKVVRW